MVIKVILPHQAPEYFTQEVSKSTQRHRLKISENAKDYLVNLLNSFINLKEQAFIDNDVQFWDKSITLMYKACEEELSRSIRELRFQQLGDVCLFRMGYFYDSIKQNGDGQVRYHIEIGTTSYSRLPENKLNHELSTRFKDLTVIIGDLHLPQLNNDKKFLSTLQKWSETKDERYSTLLRSKGVIIPKYSNN